MKLQFIVILFEAIAVSDVTKVNIAFNTRVVGAFLIVSACTEFAALPLFHLLHCVLDWAIRNSAILLLLCSHDCT